MECIVLNYDWHTDTNIQKHGIFVRPKREMVKGKGHPVICHARHRQGNRGTAPPTRNLGTSWKWVVNSTPSPI